MSKLKFYNNLCFLFLFLVILQILVKFSLYNCTFYDFGIIFRRQNFLDEKNFKDFFGGHIRLYEMFLNFFFNRINNLLIYYLLICFQILIYFWTFFYLRRKNKILSLIFILNPIVVNPLFFDFHFEYLAVLFTAVFFYNSHKKYSLFFLLPIIFVSEIYAFFSLFLILIYFRNYKVNSFGLIFSITILIYVYLAIFHLFDWAVGGVYLKYNFNYQIEILYLIFSLVYIIFFLNKKFCLLFSEIGKNYIIIFVNIIILFFFIFFSIHFNNINFINLNNHYFLIISFLSSIIIYNFFIKNNYYKFMFSIFFLIFNPTVLGMQFYLNKGSSFYYKNYINFYNLESQKIISRFILSIDKTKNILVNNNLCNIEAFNIKNILIFEDKNYSKKIDYIIFSFNNLSSDINSKLIKFLENSNVEYIEKNKNYVIAKIK